MELKLGDGYFAFIVVSKVTHFHSLFDQGRSLTRLCFDGGQSVIVDMAYEDFKVWWADAMKLDEWSKVR